MRKDGQMTFADVGGGTPLMLEWYVLWHDFNARQIEWFNIFEHASFLDECKKWARKYKDDKFLFTEAVKRSMMYYFWARCEWEVVVSGWPPSPQNKDSKVDAYEQIVKNWDAFADYIWSHAAELRRREKKT